MGVKAVGLEQAAFPGQFGPCWPLTLGALRRSGGEWFKPVDTGTPGACMCSPEAAEQVVSACWMS